MAAINPCAVCGGSPDYDCTYPECPWQRLNGDRRPTLDATKEADRAKAAELVREYQELRDQERDALRGMTVVQMKASLMLLDHRDDEEICGTLRAFIERR